MKIFETDRLYINAPSLENIENLAALFSDPEVMYYVGHGVKTRDETREYIEKMIEHCEKHGFVFGNVYEKATNEFVGSAGLFRFEKNDDSPDVELGYAMHKKFWGRGYATELVKSLIDWAFNNLAVKKLLAVTRPENEASRHVMEKSGMHYVELGYFRGEKSVKYEIYKKNINYTDLTLLSASLEYYPIIQNMARFYVYDMSQYFPNDAEWAIPNDGLYECLDFKKYWQDKEAHPFLIHYKNELVGFMIIDKKGSDSEIDFNMAQFFILNKFKNKGVGRYIAQHCFDTFRGVWEIMVIPGNEGAYRFWRSIVSAQPTTPFH